MDLKGMRVAVIGGGIGGMAAATALALRGGDVHVFEQAPALEEVGAGLQISANGQAVLAALGVELTGVSGSAGTEIQDGRTGRKVAFVPAPSAGPTWYVHRADLLGALLVCAEKAGVSTVLDRLVTPGTIQADLIVAADGGQSIWRSTVDGPCSPRFTGQVAWRALVPAEAGQEAAAPSTLSMGSRAHVVTYPLRAAQLMNLVAVEERSSWSEEGWRQQGDVDEFRARFSDFKGPAGEIIARVETVHLWALHLRPVARHWWRDNIALLGDAAHPTLPFMAQGACMALEDVWVLADALSRSDDLAASLALYQRMRQKRAEQVVALARGNAMRFHLPRPWSWGAQAVLSVGAGALARRLDWVYDYDATQVL